MRKLAEAVVILVGVGACAVLLFASRRPPVPAPDRIPALQHLLAERERLSTEAIAAYQAATPAHIDDLAHPVDDLLRGLPGVVEIKVGVKVEKPTSRIIHLRDWHIVPKDLFALDFGKGATAQEIDRRYREHLLEVEVVQMEQMALLWCLIRHHGLKTVFCEGLTPGELPNFRETVGVLRDMERKDMPRVKGHLAEVPEMLKKMEPTTDRYERARAL